MGQHPLYSDDTDPYGAPHIAYIPDHVVKAQEADGASKAEEIPGPAKTVEPESAAPVRSPLLFSIGILLITLSVLFFAGSGGFLYYANQSLNAAHDAATKTAQDLLQFGTRLAATGTVNPQATPTVVPSPTAIISPTPTGTPDVKATATAGPQATATAKAVTSQNPYPAYKKLMFFDTLANNSERQWNEGNFQSGGGCQFSNNAYHVATGTTGTFAVCESTTAKFSDAVLQVQMSIIQGNCGGLSFRTNNDAFYIFVVCQDGTYQVRRFNGNNKNPPSTSLTSGSDQAIKQGLKQPNLIAVAAHGSTLDLFVNGKRVATANDSTFTQGGIGLLAFPVPSSDGSSFSATEAAYTNATVWTP